MLRPKACHLFQAFLPSVQGLERYPGHQVNIDISKSFSSCHLVGMKKILKCMDSSQDLQLLVSDGLQSDTQAADSHLAICDQLLRGYRSRIHLNGDLRILVHHERLPYRIKYGEYLCRNKEGGGPSSYEYAYNMISLCQRPVRTDPLAKAFHILLPLPLFRGRGQEITIFTFTDAKWNMNI